LEVELAQQIKNEKKKGGKGKGQMIGIRKENGGR
jgi:hypothetical protein